VANPKELERKQTNEGRFTLGTWRRSHVWTRTEHDVLNKYTNFTVHNFQARRIYIEEIFSSRHGVCEGGKVDRA
jgi:hypothetical protein